MSEFRTARRGELHGRSKSPEYYAWWNMLNRCYNPKVRGYALYGPRGITVCESWSESFTAFLKDAGPRPSPEYSLERVDNNGNYEPGNCKWATKDEQASNRRSTRLVTIEGVTQTLQKWARQVGVSHATMIRRLARNYPVDMLLAKRNPPGIRRNNATI